MRSMQQGEHQIYESLADNHTFYSAVFQRISPGERPLYLYLTPTDSRLNRKTREIAFNRGIVFRVPESVLTREMDPESVKQLLTEQAPQIFESELTVDRAVDQLHILVNNYSPPQRQE